MLTYATINFPLYSLATRSVESVYCCCLPCMVKTCGVGRTAFFLQEGVLVPWPRCLVTRGYRSMYTAHGTRHTHTRARVAEHPIAVNGVTRAMQVDAEARKVSTAQAQDWCKENGDMAYFETSAKVNVLRQSRPSNCVHRPPLESNQLLCVIF